MPACARCRNVKPVHDFHRHTRSRSGLQSYCKTCTREHWRERKDAIDAGLWNPPKCPSPEVEPSPSELAWCAGFLCGEGHFFHRTNSRACGISAGQITRDPLETLARFLGGSIRDDGVTSAGNPVWEWNVTGSRAREAMVDLYPHLTIAKKAQVERSLEEWPEYLAEALRRKASR